MSMIMHEAIIAEAAQGAYIQKHQKKIISNLLHVVFISFSIAHSAGFGQIYRRDGSKQASSFSRVLFINSS